VALLCGGNDSSEMQRARSFLERLIQINFQVFFVLTPEFHRRKGGRGAEFHKSGAGVPNLDLNLVNSRT
jgi:hypothetical protein